MMNALSQSQQVQLVGKSDKHFSDWEKHPCGTAQEKGSLETLE